LPNAKKGSIGFGGLFRNKIINHPVILTFHSDEGNHKINYASGFQIVCIPPNATPEEKEKMRRYTPSVLGMEILGKFQVYVDKKKAELTLV